MNVKLARNLPYVIDGVSESSVNFIGSVLAVPFALRAVLRRRVSIRARHASPRDVRRSGYAHGDVGTGA